MAKKEVQFLDKNSFSEQRSFQTSNGTRAFYNLALIVAAYASNYAIFLWAAIALNAFYFYDAMKNLTRIIDEEKEAKEK